MAQPVIVDTNVLLVANGFHAKADLECLAACGDKIAEIQTGQLQIVLDEIGLILKEYGNKLTPRMGGLGEQFLLWLFNNKYKFEKVEITPIRDADGETIIDFEEFPKDPALANFDRSDKKFVAVALSYPTSPKPPILNAADDDWQKKEKELKAHGVTVEFLCPTLVKSSL